MREGLNVEVAHTLAESGGASNLASQTLREDLLEITEAFVLAVVAVATAWCGYQASKWDSNRALQYGISARSRVEAAVAATEGGQQRLLDVVTFNTWIQAKEVKDEKLSDLYVRRFSPEYRLAFDAWLKTDPFSKPNGPAGPVAMPDYHNSLLEKASQSNHEASAAFAEGTRACEISEKYVRNTLLLAVVLFLVVVAQRFKRRKLRISLLVLASLLMILSLIPILLYPQS
jgi:hypothetical protein